MNRSNRLISSTNVLEIVIVTWHQTTTSNGVDWFILCIDERVVLHLVCQILMVIDSGKVRIDLFKGENTFDGVLCLFPWESRWVDPEEFLWFEIWRIESSLFLVTSMKDAMDGSREKKRVNLLLTLEVVIERNSREWGSIFFRSRWTIHRTWKWRRRDTGSGLFRCHPLVSEESRHVWTFLFSLSLFYWSCCRSLLINETMCRAPDNDRPAGSCEEFPLESIDRQGEFFFLSLPESHPVEVSIRLTVHRESSCLSLDFSQGKNVSNGNCLLFINNWRFISILIDEDEHQRRSNIETTAPWRSPFLWLFYSMTSLSLTHLTIVSFRNSAWTNERTNEEGESVHRSSFSVHCQSISVMGNQRFFRRFLAHKTKRHWFQRWKKNWIQWVLDERWAKRSEINLKSKWHDWQVISQTNAVLNSPISSRRKNEEEEEERADSMGMYSERMISCSETFSFDQWNRIEGRRENELLSFTGHAVCPTARIRSRLPTDSTLSKARLRDLRISLIWSCKEIKEVNERDLPRRCSHPKPYPSDHQSAFPRRQTSIRSSGRRAWRSGREDLKSKGDEQSSLLTMLFPFQTGWIDRVVVQLHSTHLLGVVRRGMIRFQGRIGTDWPSSSGMSPIFIEVWLRSMFSERSTLVLMNSIVRPKKSVSLRAPDGPMK